MKRSMILSLFALSLLANTYSTAQAQGKFGETAPDFPPGIFSDSMRYQLSDCRGKVVVLFFYESQCPRCKGSIPERNEIVKSFDGKPVKFIAVGASDPVSDVASYLQETKLAMPVFVDNLGIMETRYGQRMSLNNIWQMRVIGPDGKIVGYDMNKETVEKALKGASWKYDPKDYDPKLKSTLNAFEWNQWNAGMKLLLPLRRSGTKTVAESANKLYNALKKEAAAWKDEAKKISDEDPVKAYDLYNKVTTFFANEQLGMDLFEPKKKLASTKAVQSELAARKAFEQINIAIPRLSPQEKKLLSKQLQSIVKRYDGTRTAQTASALAKEIDK